MPTTKNARTTTAALTDHDALPFWCVMLSHFVRHELNRIISLPHMHTSPPKTLNPELTPNTVPSGAEPLSRAPLVSPSDPQPHYNEPLTPVSEKSRNFWPLAPPMPREPPLPSPTTHTPTPHRIVKPGDRMRRWNGWGDEATTYPLPESAARYLESVIGKGPAIPDAT